MDQTRAYPTLREANAARQAEWDTEGRITLTFRATELAGEVGEACNLAKKIERERLGISGSRATLDQLADELADVAICVDLLAMGEGIDLAAAIARKFNATSEKVGLQTRLAPPDLKCLQDEITYWRQDAAARLRTAVTLAQAAQRRGELDEAARITVGTIYPTVAALGNALSGDIYYPLCEHCGDLVGPGDAVVHFEGGEVAHLSCENRQWPDPLPPEATRYQIEAEATPEGVRKALEDARAYLSEEEPIEPDEASAARTEGEG